jgi:hypothetical protein
MVLEMAAVEIRREQGMSESDDAGLPTPRTSRKMVAYVARMSPGYRWSEDYQIDCDGDYGEYLDMGVTVMASYARYVKTVVRRVVEDRSLMDRWAPVIRADLEIIELLCAINRNDILTAVATGAFEDFTDAEGLVLDTLFANFGPRSKALWREFIPIYFTTRVSPGAGVKIMEWNKRAIPGWPLVR